LAGEGSAGIEVHIATAILPAGTGTFAPTYSGTVWSQIVAAYVLPPCSVVDAAVDSALSADTDIVLTTAETVEAEDLAFSILAQLSDTAISVPASWTSAVDFSGVSHHRHRLAWRNGSLPSPTLATWSGLSGTVPQAAAAAVFRRT
jgi:hypothetical protein